VKFENNRVCKIPDIVEAALRERPLSLRDASLPNDAAHSSQDQSEADCTASQGQLVPEYELTCPV
jgi:hypothetical protein